MINNNVNARHRVPVRQAADQEAPQAAQQIAHNEPERPLARAQDNPNRAPGWMHRIRRGLQQGVNAIRDNREVLARRAGEIGPRIIYGAVAVGVVDQLYNFGDREYIPHEGPRYAAGVGVIITVVGPLLMMLLQPVVVRQDIIDRLRQNDLAGRSLAEVINEFRAQRASSSSASAPVFDWSQPGLFVDQGGQNVAHEVSHFLDRILYAIKSESEQNMAENYRDINNYLDLLAQDPAARTALADCVFDLNQACFNRNAQSINSILRQMRTKYPESMPFKDFILTAVVEVALKEADKKLIDCMKKKGLGEPVVETQQALQGDILRTLRKKIPELPRQFERVYQGYDNCVELTGEERRALSEEIVKAVIDPVECSRLLQMSKKENAFMEKRFGDVLNQANVDAPLSEENRVKAYEELAKQNGKDDIELDEMMEVDEKLQRERDTAVQAVYAELIKDPLKSLMHSNEERSQVMNES